MTTDNKELGNLLASRATFIFKGLRNTGVKWLLDLSYLNFQFAITLIITSL
jgi:hypothetical protein